MRRAPQRPLSGLAISSGILLVGVWLLATPLRPAAISAVAALPSEDSHFGLLHPDPSLTGFLSELGVHWARPHPGPFIWGRIQRTQNGPFEWSRPGGVDATVAAHQAANLNIIATIWPYADWDQETCHQPVPGGLFPPTGSFRQKPCDLALYAGFVRRLVERYDGDGIDDFPGLRFPVRYWEVINEPDPFMNGWFFVGSEEDYLEVLQVTHDAIKEADPSAKVLNGGMPYPPRPDFWERLFSLGALDYIDVVNHHSINVDDHLLIPDAQSWFPRYGLPGDRQWWIPEVTFNWRTLGERPHTAREAGAVILCSHLFAFSEGVAKLFYGPLEPRTTNISPEFVLLQEVAPGTYARQEPFFAYKTMVQNVDYFDEVNRIQDDPATYEIVKGRYVTYALCGDFVPSGIKGTVHITDLLGAQQDVPATDLVNLEKPLYVHHMIASIDVKPGGDAAPINPASRGTIPVAILSTADFHAPDEVDRNSLTFGATGREESLAFCNAAGEDVNDDGLLDLVCHFRTAETGFARQDTLGILEGQTTARFNFRGTDSIRIVGSSR